VLSPHSLMVCMNCSNLSWVIEDSGANIKDHAKQMLIQFAFISDLTSNKARVGVSKSYFSLFEEDFWHSCVLILSRLEILVSSKYSQLWVRFCSVLPLFQTMLLYHSSPSTIWVLKHVWQPTREEIGLSKWKFGIGVRKLGKSDSKHLRLAGCVQIGSITSTSGIHVIMLDILEFLSLNHNDSKQTCNHCKQSRLGEDSKNFLIKHL
jgi:hypothetical protein